MSNAHTIPATPGTKVVIEGLRGMFPGVIVSSFKGDRTIDVKVTVAYYDLPKGTIVTKFVNCVHPRENWNRKRGTVRPVAWELGLTSVK